MNSKPLEAGKVRHHIDRIYRTQATAYIWARELLVNAGEAGATRCSFAVEPQGAESGVLRRVVIDDGCGMTHEQLVEFFSGWGVGSKAIGGDHDNMGIGAKTMTLPWNPAGVVVVSKTAEMDHPAVVWLHYDPDLDDYGLREFEVEGPDGDTWMAPAAGAHHDDELGIDLAGLLPDWAADHGTAVLLVGRHLDDHTVLGAVEDGETSASGLGRYLNQRFDTPPYGMDITVEHVRGDTPKEWAASIAPAGDARHEAIDGHQRFTHGTRSGEGPPTAGVVELHDGTLAHWVLRATDQPASTASLAPVKRGAITVGYDRPDGSGRELFDRTTNQGVYRAMGVAYPEVAKRLYVTFVPPRTGEGEGGAGALMETSRSSLRWIAANGTRGQLPTSDWYAQFATRMPQPIVEALDEARSSGEVDITHEDVSRLQAQFGDRWKGSRMPAADPDGDLEVADDPTRDDMPGTPGTEPSGRQARAHRRRGTRPAALGDGRGGVPRGEAVRLDKFGADRHHLACFTGPSSSNPTGLVQVNVDHPVVREEVTHWAELFPAHLHSEVEEIVHRCYVVQAVAVAAHVESLRRSLKLGSSTIDVWRSPDGLTTALLGLWGLEARISRALKSLGVRRQAA